MQQARLETQMRGETGKGAARSLRRIGMVPGVLYGLEEPNILLQINERNLQDLLNIDGVENSLINLELGDDASETVMIKEIQRDPVRRNVLHADFVRISLEKEITTRVPITLLGTPIGVRASGGIQEFTHWELEIRCLPTVIPDNIELDVTDMLIGDFIHVSDITPEGIEVSDEPETIIVAIRPPRVVTTEEPVEAAVAEEEAEPEVITRRREEEEEAV